MYVIVREYKVAPGNEETFDELFGPDGERARFFRDSSRDYVGSEVLRGDADTTRFLAVERWRSQRVYERFALAHTEELAALEKKALGITEAQRLIGDFTVADEEPVTG